MLELCQRFSHTADRRAILRGLLELRKLLNAANFKNGFQWLAGSFLEDIETRASRPPNDVDVVTCFVMPPAEMAAAAAAHPILVNPREIKIRFKVDHFLSDIAHHPYFTVENVRYWIGLFSHRRDGIWKGILRIELNTPADDADAETYLNGLS